MKQTRILFLYLSILVVNSLWAQSDTILFSLRSEVEFTGTYFVYSGAFDQAHPEYLYVACKNLGLLTFLSHPKALTAIDTLTPDDLGGHQVSNVLVQEPYLYVGLGAFQGNNHQPDLGILNVEDPAELRELGRFGLPQYSVATWGLAATGNRITLFQIDNSAVLPISPQPFYSDYGSVRLLEWERVPTEIMTIEPLLAPVRVFPNPFWEELRVSISSDEVDFPCMIQLFNLQGQLIHNRILRESVNVLPTHDLAAGFYFYRVLNANREPVGVGKLSCE